MIRLLFIHFLKKNLSQIHFDLIGFIYGKYTERKKKIYALIIYINVA